MINWIRNALHNFIFPQAILANETRPSGKNRGIVSTGRSLDSRGMNFTIHMANGGYVLEYSTYNEKTDRHDNSLHIIPSDQDMGQGIAHVITLELLRK
jgi:hypothetical protein